ncbi:MAG: hypothetical protein ACFFDI_27760, partial [Promethearchaeota archaeon]
RVSWTYQGKRTYGVVTSIGGKRATLNTPNGGTVTRVGTDDDPIVRKPQGIELVLCLGSPVLLTPLPRSEATVCKDQEAEQKADP